MKKNPYNKGYTILISVLLIGAVGTSIVTSILLLGLGAAQSHFSLQQSYQAKALANLCAEEALQQIRSNTNFTGSNTLTIGSGSCSYTITNNGGQSRTITSLGTIGSIIRKNQILVSNINPQIQISSWQEVAD